MSVTLCELTSSAHSCFFLNVGTSGAVNIFAGHVQNIARLSVACHTVNNFIVSTSVQVDFGTFEHKGAHLFYDTLLKFF